MIEFLDRKLPINKPIINTCGDVITPSETYREFMKKHMRAMETYIATQAAFFHASKQPAGMVVMTENGPEDIADFTSKMFFAVAMPKDHPLHQQELETLPHIQHMPAMLRLLEGLASGKRTETGPRGLFVQEKDTLAKAVENIGEMQTYFKSYVNVVEYRACNWLVSELRKKAEPEDSKDMLLTRFNRLYDGIALEDPDVELDREIHKEKYDGNNAALAAIMADMEQQLQPIMKRLGVGAVQGRG